MLCRIRQRVSGGGVGVGGGLNYVPSSQISEAELKLAEGG